MNLDCDSIKTDWNVLFLKTWNHQSTALTYIAYFIDINISNTNVCNTAL